MGAGQMRIMVRHLSPSCLQPFLVAATVQVGLTMVAEAALSFLGLGVPVAQASWGSTIANGRDYLASAWWIAAAPGVALTVVVICIAVLGETIRATADPAGRTRRPGLARPGNDWRIARQAAPRARRATSARITTP